MSGKKQLNKEDKLMVIDTVDTVVQKLIQKATKEELLSAVRDNLKKNDRRVIDDVLKEQPANANVFSKEEVMSFYDKIVEETFGDGFPDDVHRGMKHISAACWVLESLIDGYLLNKWKEIEEQQKLT